MRVTIRQKDFEITPALRQYIEERVLNPVARFVKNIPVPDLPILDLEIGRWTRHHKKGDVYHVAASLALNGKLIRVEAENEDVHAACDEVEEQLKQEITSYKSRAFSLLKRGARAAKKMLRLDAAARFFRRGRIRDEGN